MNALLTRIACSLRARPHRALSFPGGKRAAVALLLRQRGVEVDLFFILRAVNPRDLWSGQVGLPGVGPQTAFLPFLCSHASCQEAACG